MKLTRLANNALQTPILLFTIARNIKRQRNFINSYISPELEKARRAADGSVDDKDFKKITGYYGLAVPGVLGDSFCALRGKSMSEKERLASTCQGVITGLGDDYFDKKNVSNQALKEMIDHPEKFEGATAFEKLSLHFLRSAMSNSPDPKLMHDQLEKVFVAQVLSKKQSSRGLSIEEIRDITIRKGAESLLFYRTVFSHPLGRKEEKALYCLGGLMQLSNDIFDLYEDLQHGIETLLTTAEHIRTVRTFFLVLMHLGYEAAYKTDYPRACIKKFINIISISIFSRCLVCLDQLERNEKRSGNVFSPAKYKRKDLVCDMDRAGNILKSIKYHIKYAGA